MSTQMEHTTHDNDLEAPIEESVKPKSTPNMVQLMEAGGLLLLWSVFVINEGSIRVMDTTPGVDLLASGRPPRFVRFLAGLAEVVFGIIGVAVGLCAFIFRKQKTSITKLSMVIQTILGYFVFIVFVFVVPIFATIDTDVPMLDGLTVGQSRFIIILGALTSFHFCLALQGGQFVFFARVVTGGTGEDFLRQKSGARMRSLFWNGNMALSGLWTLITGAIVISNVSGGKLDMPFVSPPNVGLLPGMTVFTGVAMLVWGIVGMFISGMNIAVPSFYYIITVFLYIWGLLNFGIVQFGLLPVANPGAVALHNGLVFMVVFIGPYFVHLSEKERLGEEF